VTAFVPFFLYMQHRNKLMEDDGKQVTCSQHSMTFLQNNFFYFFLKSCMNHY